MDADRQAGGLEFEIGRIGSGDEGGDTNLTIGAVAGDQCPCHQPATGGGDGLSGIVNGGGGTINAVVYAMPVGGNPPRSAPRSAIMDQVNKEFLPFVVPVLTGTAVTFPNKDNIRHHVYSFSPAKKFEIKLYVGTPASPVVFDQTGIAVLGCNIHDNMAAWVVIVDTPWFGRTDADGRLQLASVPAGRYNLRAWHPGMTVGAQPVEQALQVDAAPLAASVTLAGVRP